MNLREIIAHEKNAGIDAVVKDFEHDGIECVVRVVRDNHYSGCIRVPDGVDVPSAILIDGWYNYGPDCDGWVGFDTGHAGDVNLDENQDPLPGDLNQLEERRARSQPNSSVVTYWDPDDVAEELRKTAELIET